MVLEKLYQSIYKTNELKYTGIWILYHSEENPTREFSVWMCKAINTCSNKDLSQLPLHEKYWSIYEAMIKIGKQLTAEAKEKQGKSNIAMTVLKSASEVIPKTEELQTIAGKKEMTLKDFYEFYFIPPDIHLESEKVWPPAPNIEY